MNGTRTTLMAAALAVLLLVGARPALAGHYDLADVPELMEGEILAKVAAQGIRTTKQLLDATTTKKARAALAKKTGQSRKIVEWWANFSDLLRVDGIGPRMAKLIQLAGVANIKGLRAETAAGLEAKVTAANAKFRVTELLPSQGHLENWIGQAKALPIVIE